MSAVLQLNPEDDAVIANRLKRSTVECCKGQCYLIDIVDDEPVFAEVDWFVCRTDE